MPIFQYSNNLSHEENYSRWRLENSHERIHSNLRLLNDKEAKERFEAYYGSLRKKI